MPGTHIQYCKQLQQQQQKQTSYILIACANITSKRKTLKIRFTHRLKITKRMSET